MNKLLVNLIKELKSEKLVSEFNVRKQGTTLRGIFLALSSVFKEDRDNILKELESIGVVESKSIEVKTKVSFQKTKAFTPQYNEEGRCLNCGQQTKSKYDRPINEIQKVAQDLSTEQLANQIEKDKKDPKKKRKTKRKSSITKASVKKDTNIFNQTLEKSFEASNERELMMFFMQDLGHMKTFAEKNNIDYAEGLSLAKMNTHLFNQIGIIKLKQEA